MILFILGIALIALAAFIGARVENTRAVELILGAAVAGGVVMMFAAFGG